MAAKQPTSFKLTPEARIMLKRLAAKLGLSQAGVLELAIRRLAETEGVPQRTKDDRGG